METFVKWKSVVPFGFQYSQLDSMKNQRKQNIMAHTHFNIFYIGCKFLSIRLSQANILT